MMDLKELLSREHNHESFECIASQIPLLALRVTGRLGEGNNQRTYAVTCECERADDPRFLALKIIECADAQRQNQRLGSLLGKVQAANVDRVLMPIHHGTTSSGALFYTSDLFEHDLGCLSEIADHLRLEIVTDVARALRDLHSCGVVHGNLKPTNVVLRSGPAGYHTALTDLALQQGNYQERDVLAWGAIAAHVFGAALPGSAISELVQRVQEPGHDKTFTAAEIVVALEHTASGQRHSPPAPPSLTADADVATLLLREGFEMLSVLGRGASATVYRVRRTGASGGHEVALKLFVRGQGEERIKRTRRILSRLRSFCNAPYVVPKTLGRLQGGQFFYTTEMFSSTLRQSADHMSLAELLDALREVSRALGQLDRLDILHRDIKPSNVLVKQIDGQRKIVLADFGLAVLVATDTDQARRQVVGTPGYRPPEAGAVSATSAWDIWSFGATCLSLLSQRFLDDPQALSPVMHHRELDRCLPDVPAEFLGVVARCLDPDHKKRPTADEVTALLSPVIAHLCRSEIGASNAAREPAQLYKGLESFSSDDQDHFYGRDQDRQQVMSLLDDTHWLILLGPSGVGKTSFLRAGLIPHLQTSGERGARPCRVVAFRPGQDPLGALVRTLRDEGVLSSKYPETASLGELNGSALWRLMREAAGLAPRFVLVVDQGEELFTVATETARIEFTSRLDELADVAARRDSAAAPPPLQIIVSVREDFYGPLLALPPFAKKIAHRYHRLPALDELALCEALEKPAAHFGYRWEPGVLSHMVSRVSRSHSGLPLLQLAASEMWEHRDRRERMLRVCEYQRLGGVSGAIERHADAVFDALVDEETLFDKSIPIARSRRRNKLDTVLREIFLRLVDADNRSRRPMDATELVAQFAANPSDATLAEQVLSRLIDQRLLTCCRAPGRAGAAQPDESNLANTVEIQHESLISGWSRLRRWLDEQGPRKQLMEEICARASEWRSAGFAEGALWSGDHFLHQRSRIKKYRVSLTQREAEFLSACVERTRGRRRWRRVAWFAAVIALTALAFQGIILLQRAERSRRETERIARVTEARRLAVEAREKVHRDAASSLALIQKSMAIAEVAEAHAAAREFLDVWTAPRGIHTVAARVTGLVFDPRGRYLLSGNAATELVVWPLEDGEPRFFTHTMPITRLGFSGDGKWVTWSDRAGQHFRWSLSSGLVQRSEKNQGVSRPESTSVDGWRHVIDASGALTLVHEVTGKTIEVARGFGTRTVIAIDPQKRWLASGGEMGRVSLWNLPVAGASEFEARLHQWPVGAAGSQGATTWGAGEPGEIRTLRLPSGWMHMPLVYVADVWIGQTEVTQAQYEAVMEQNPSPYHDRDFPITNISALDALRFCQRLATMTGLPVRLPSETEWEHAAASGQQQAPWKNDATQACLHANIADRTYARAMPGSGFANCSDQALGITMVASYRANASGLYDMIGNVAELTLASQEQPPSSGADWARFAARYAEVRGGSYSDDVTVGRAAKKSSLRTQSSDHDIGFRIAIDAGDRP